MARVVQPARLAAHIFTAGSLIVWVERVCPNRGLGQRIFHASSKLTNRLVGMRVEVVGLDKLDPQQAFVFTPDHRSHADITALMAALPAVRFAAKRELFDEPVLGTAMRALGMIPIDRDDPALAKRTLDEAAAKLGKAVSVVIDCGPTGTVAERKEAKAQGVSSVKVWDCGLQCYDKRLVTEAQGATEGQYVWLNLLPIEDGNANPELAKFLHYDKAPDAFGQQAWVTGEIFARAVNDAMAANGNDPNAITRAQILTALRNLHDFNAGGMLPPGTDIGSKKMSLCLVGMQVQNGKFVRIDPAQPGTFDCDNNKPPIVQTIDPAKEYHG